MILAQAILQLFCWENPLWFKCLSLKMGIIQSNTHRILWKVNQVIYIMYPYCMPDIMILAQADLQILLTGLLYYTNCQSQKREIIQSNINRILPKVNQVTYTLDTVYMPKIMILAHGVIQIFCWQGSIGLQCISWKREIIQPNIHRILWKVNHVIYTLDTICVSNIIILFKRSQYFVDKVLYGLNA